MRLLLVEDDERMASFIVRGLRERSYAVDLAADSRQALFQAFVHPYDAIILDVMIPGEDGYAVCRRMRERGLRTPILMLTARDAVADRIHGLDCGADDYLTKPFAFGELLARLRAVLRRAPELLPTVITVADLELDTRGQRAARGGESLTLTQKEYALLEFLARNAGRVVGRAEISDHVWDDNFDPASNTLEVTIARLRRKLEEGGRPPLIHTRRGAGYLLDEPGAESPV